MLHSESQDEVIERMSRAARPTIFEAACDPELLFALVLSNLMSPLLWTFRANIEHDRPALLGDGGPQARLMEAIQHYVNEHFFHQPPLDVSDAWGVVDLEEVRQQLGRQRIDAELAVIVEEMNSREAHGEAMDRIDVVPLIEKGQFPEYTYTTLDVLHAERAILKRKKHKPLGVTSCADEAILIASLASVLHGMAIDELVIFGSVAHYTAFLRHDDFSCWFNGKREYFFKDSWTRGAGQSAAGSAQAAFDARLASFDRIVTPLGTCLLRDGSSTIAPARLRAIDDALTDFFGIRLRQLDMAHAASARCGPGPLSGFSFAALDRMDDVATVAATLRAMAADRPGTLIEAALYAFRDLDVRHPEAYVRAALRGHRARQAAQNVRSLQDAVARVRAVAGGDSIFGTRERISLPDEVLRLDTGSDRDKALLLYTLIRQAPWIPAADTRDAEILFTAEDSYVRVGTAYVDTRMFERHDRVDGEVVRRLA